ncbi:peptidase C48, SUMO/sentrin/Ubl1 [Tanacetum coccineum]|uniref:Peptidase C48, SUMO/sentrin/Ubl1 n=1 Tax=Tanacetum coccineum TaxID=301880 RepID=A0ABQ5J861_9ASTR
MEFESKTDEEIRDTCAKLRETLQRREAEIDKRKGGTKGEENLVFVDLTDGGESCRGGNKYPSLIGGGLYGREIDKDEYGRRLKEFYEPCMLKSKRKKIKKSDQVSGKGQSKPMVYSKPKPSGSQTTPKFDNRKNIISNGDREVKSRDSFSRRRAHTPPQQPLTKSMPKLVDEDDDQEKEPLVWKPCAQKLSDCMLDVNYKDVACLEPDKWLSSGIMNFYIRYLQLTSSSENMIQNSHFFTTFFYIKLQHKYKGDAFLKLRKWWKNVNLFEKAYIFVPINERTLCDLIIQR